MIHYNLCKTADSATCGQAVLLAEQPVIIPSSSEIDVLSRPLVKGHTRQTVVHVPLEAKHQSFPEPKHIIYVSNIIKVFF